MNTEQANPIDAVILWVDGNDSLHREKMLPYLPENFDTTKSKHRTRYDQVDEIAFTVQSLIKYATFLRNIFIVTDNQIPKFFQETNDQDYYKKVTIVDHKVIFNGYQNVLPTFSNRSIETCIHRIPDLAEHFIYLNDDFFLINKTTPSDFFKNGFPVLRGKWLKFDENIFYKKFKKPRLGHKSAQQRSAKIAGFNSYYNFKHTPHPLRKSTLEDFFKNNKVLFENNISYRFRNTNQFLIQGLANHLEIKNNSCHLDKNLRLVYFRSYKKSVSWYKKFFTRVSKKNLFLGLQSLDLCPNDKRDLILQWLKERVS